MSHLEDFGALAASGAGALVALYRETVLLLASTAPLAPKAEHEVLSLKGEHSTIWIAVEEVDMDLG